jgi:hypothetical protein
MTGLLASPYSPWAVTARLISERYDPFTVTAVIRRLNGGVRIWTIGRDLLLTGLTTRRRSGLR